MLLLEIPEEIR